jgi:NMD protein affecting ribosome stability and mRNA decay
MDFCVKCGRKKVYKEHLCSKCYNHINKLKPVKLKKAREKSNQKHAGYFEAVVQLRNVDQKVVDFVYRGAEEHHVTVAKVKWLKHGVDLFVSDKLFARKIGKALQQKFGGMVKSSATLFTQDKMSGKKVYRVTVLFKQFPYGKGERFTFKGEVYIVLGVAKNVHVEDENNTRRNLRFSELQLDRVF